MAEKPTTKTSASDAEKAKASTAKPKVSKEVPGDFTYTGSHGVLKKFLDIATEASRPDIVNSEYLESKGLTGGSARAIPPILKKMGFLDTAGKPTEWYAKFQTKGSRSEAALHGLKQAYQSIFDRNRFAHTLTDDKLKDIVIEISGLDKTSSTLRAILGTYDVIKSYINFDELTASGEAAKDDQDAAADDAPDDQEIGSAGRDRMLGLSYQINIVLPETTDITIYNAIFKSLKENLL